MALSFHSTTAPLFGHHRLPAAADMMSFLQDDDDHSEVTDALLGFVYDPLDASNAALDDLLSLPLDGATGAEWHCGKRQRIGTGSQQVPAMTGALTNNEYVLQLPLPPPPPPPVPDPTTQVPEPLVFVRGAAANKAGGGACQSVQKSAARQRRKRISEKTAELARLIPGAHKLNTAEMLEEAARHVKLLQAQVGVLALMRAAGSSEEEEKMPSPMAQERMHALLACGSVQERLAAEGKCLVPTSLVDAVAKDDAAKANPVVRRDLGRFVASLQQGQ
ncbi:bHLH transcription factor RHL1-like [Miscanthus floridulus]|uniref:bHLH transcription factor RHL1-like n=1 Tax=Miscanthus floridulus TaxID=154761 RepID=UPI003459DFB2